MKKPDVLREYVRHLNDDDLKYLSTRLSQRFGGDVGESVEIMQRNFEMERWLASACSAADFFDMIDTVDNCVQYEAKKRFGYESKEKSTKTISTSNR